MLQKPLTALALFSGLALLWMWPFSLSPASMVPDVGDPLHLAYIMAWDAHQLAKDPARLFEANSFYPWPSSLAFADHLLPEAILAAPLLWATGNPALAYNAMVFVGLVLSALTMRALLIEATGSAEAGLLAGVVYAFNGLTLVETTRVHVIQLQWWPLALLFLGRFNRSASWAAAFGLALSLALQGLSGSYYLVFSALVAPLWLGIALLGRTARPDLRGLGRLAVAALVAAVPVVLVLMPYLARGLPRSRVSRGVDLLAFASPMSQSPMWSWLLPGDPYGREFRGVLGALLLAAGILALRGMRDGWPRRLGLIALSTAIFGGLLALGDRVVVGGVDLGPGPHHLLTALAPLQGLRHTPRFNALVILGSAILVGLAVATWIGRRGRPPLLVTLLLVVLLPAEHWRTSTYGKTLPAPEWWRRAYADLPRAPLVDLPVYPPVKTRFWAAYPFASTYHWNPVPIGRTSFYPPGHHFLARLLLDFPDERSVGILGRLGIRTIVLHPGIWSDEERARKLADVDRLPGLQRIERVVPDAGPNDLLFGDERYYAVAPPLPQPAPCRPDAEVEPQALSVYAMNDETESDALGAVLDRDPSTRWTSGGDQSGWYGFQVRLRRPRTLAAVSVEMPPDRFPWAWPRLEIRSPGGTWTPVDAPPTTAAAWETLDELLQRKGRARLVVRFEPREIRAFRLTFASQAEGPISPFEIEELRAFGECR